jgi:hypothetical protein
MTILTQEKISKSNHLRLWAERNSHVAAGVLTLGISAGLSHIPFQQMVANGWDYGALYSSIFDLATVYSALMFGFVTYFRTAQSRFLERISPRLFQGAIDYAQSAFSLGLLLIVLSIPYILWEPVPNAPWSRESFAFAFWFGLTVAAIVAFLRASKLFWIIMSGDHERGAR